jgi:hypothetical protein
VVDVRDDAEISNELRVHFSRLPIFSIAGRIRIACPIVPAGLLHSNERHTQRKNRAYEHSVCHNSQAASACPRISCERKSCVTRLELRE